MVLAQTMQGYPNPLPALFALLVAAVVIGAAIVAAIMLLKRRSDQKRYARGFPVEPSVTPIRKLKP